MKTVEHKRAKNPVPVRMTKKRRLQELKAFVNICFSLIEEETQDFKEIANRTGLSVSTLYRLAVEDYTLAVRFGTVQAIGLAAGLSLRSTETGYAVALVK